MIWLGKFQLCARAVFAFWEVFPLGSASYSEAFAAAGELQPLREENRPRKPRAKGKSPRLLLFPLLLNVSTENSAFSVGRIQFPPHSPAKSGVSSKTPLSGRLREASFGEQNAGTVSAAHSGLGLALRGKRVGSQEKLALRVKIQTLSQ